MRMGLAGGTDQADGNGWDGCDGLGWDVAQSGDPAEHHARTLSCFCPARFLTTRACQLPAGLKSNISAEGTLSQ